MMLYVLGCSDLLLGCSEWFLGVSIVICLVDGIVLGFLMIVRHAFLHIRLVRVFLTVF